MAANTLTDLIPDLYNASDVVSRGLVGLIPAVTMNSSASTAAIDEKIRIPATQAASAVAVTPAASAPDGPGVTIDNSYLTISKSYMVPINWNGEQQMGFGNTRIYQSVFAQQIAQGMRTLTDLIEIDLAALSVNASRAYGAAGTVPFASAFSDSAQVAKILDDNGAPADDRSLVLNTAGAANLSTLLKGNFTGGGMVSSLSGELLSMDGFAYRKSAKITGPASKGTANAAYVIDGTGNTAVGSTTIKLKTGAGTILAGDLLTIGGYIYVVKTALAGALVVIQSPGLVAAVADGDAVALSSGSTLYKGNMAFSRDAIHLGLRAPAMPEGGDMADDVMTIVDPFSGIPFQIALYRQYRQVRYEVGIAWGVLCQKPQHLALLLG